jgi:geranylgeranyl reductase family protein
VPLDYDMVVIGAGPGGASAAYHAARQGWHVLLVDRAEFPREKVCGDAISARGVKVLAGMGFTQDELRQAGAQVIYSQRIYQGETLVTERQHDPQTAWTDCPLMFSRWWLDALLREKALQAGAVWHGGFEVHSVQTGPQVTIVGKKDGRPQTFHVPLAIIAAGAAAAFYRELGAPPHPCKPALGLGLRQYYQVEEDAPPGFDFFRLSDLPKGYAWVFSAGQRLNVGLWTRWTTDRIQRDLRSLFRRFLSENRAARRRLEAAQPLDQPKGALLRTLPSPTWARDRLLWVGEAAGFTTRQMGEGIMPALVSGQIAAEVASEALRTGSITALEQYYFRIVQTL